MDGEKVSLLYGSSNKQQYQTLGNPSNTDDNVIEDNKLYYKVLVRMGFYVVFFVVLWSFPLAHRVAQLTGAKDGDDAVEATPLQYLGNDKSLFCWL